MEFGRLDAGDLFLMGQGRTGAHEYVSGLYRAVTDLDFEALQAEFLALGQRFCLRREDDVPILMGKGEDRLCREVNFQLWLIEQGHVERVSCKLAMLHSEWRKSVDGKEWKAIECDVTDPVEPNDDRPQP